MPAPFPLPPVHRPFPTPQGSCQIHSVWLLSARRVSEELARLCLVTWPLSLQSKSSLQRNTIPNFTGARSLFLVCKVETWTALLAQVWTSPARPRSTLGILPCRSLLTGRSCALLHRPTVTYGLRLGSNSSLFPSTLHRRTVPAAGVLTLCSRRPNSPASPANKRMPSKRPGR